MPRPSARERGYTSAWEKARAAYLAKHPDCVECMRLGHQTKASVVDHIKPHRGDMTLFWDKANWQPLCTKHHSSSKQREESGKRVVHIGADGWPV